MKCEDCLAIIEEYFDAELNGRESKKIAEHLVACGTCNEVYESLEQEQQLYAHYERDVEITPALWQGVQARLKQESARQEISQPGVVERLRKFFTDAFHAPRFSPALAGLLVVVAVGVTVLVMNYVNSPSDKTISAKGNRNSSGPDSPTQANVNQAPQSTPGLIADKAGEKDKDEIIKLPENNPIPKKEEEVRSTPVAVKTEATNQRQLPVEKVASKTPSTTAESLLRDAEQKYIAAIAILQRDFDKRRSSLDPKLVAKLDASLASIDRTIAETRKAVRQNFDDPIAVQYMLTAYAKKVEVLRDVTAN
jgi:hypothetical protein